MLGRCHARHAKCSCQRTPSRKCENDRMFRMCVWFLFSLPLFPEQCDTKALEKMNSHLYWTVAYPSLAAPAELPALKTYIVPKYTDEACAAHWMGVITVNFAIQDDGTVTDANLDQDAFGLGDSVREVLRNWRFSPAALNGKPIRSGVIVEFGFGRKGRLSPPTVQFKPAPKPPPPGAARLVSGPLVLSIVVDEHGSPVNIRVARSLGRAWDEQGIAAIRNWRFKPGLLSNAPIATEATVAVSFP